jgi:hypothetical protein
MTPEVLRSTWSAFRSFRRVEASGEKSKVHPTTGIEFGEVVQELSRRGLHTGLHPDCRIGVLVRLATAPRLLKKKRGHNLGFGVSRIGF